MKENTLIPPCFELAFAKSECNDTLFDVYVMDEDGQYGIRAICVHGTRVDLFDSLRDEVRDHFARLLAKYDPAAEARHERAMERVAGALLGCGFLE